MFYQLPSLITFLCPNKSLYFSSQFNDRCHNSSNFFDKIFVKLCHPIEYLNFFYGFLGGGTFIIACTFFGSKSFPYLEIIKPNIIPKNTMNAHLFSSD
jgi:hypothetical protein